MEEDFEDAEKQKKAHPNINSGDLIVVPKPHQENIELCESEEETKTDKMAKFIGAVGQFLHELSPQDLSDLLEGSNTNGQSLIEKLNDAISKSSVKQAKKMIALKKELERSLANGTETITPVVNEKDEGQQLSEKKLENKLNELPEENETEGSGESEETTEFPESVAEFSSEEKKSETSSKENKEQDGYEVKLNLYLNKENNKTNDAVNQDPKIETTTVDETSTKKYEIPESEEDDEEKDKKEEVEDKQEVKSEIEKPEELKGKKSKSRADRLIQKEKVLFNLNSN